MAQTLGQYLVHSAMPDGHKFDKQTVDRKVMLQGLIGLAKADPAKYVHTVTNLKKLGDEFSTFEGISVGLDDIEPDYVPRDIIIADIEKRLSEEKNKDKRQDLLIESQKRLEEITHTHKGDMALMAKSGGRGNIAQLMKMVASPVIATNWSGDIVPWHIKHSYSEGLSPSELWVTGAEARKNTIMGVTSVIEPGEMGKLMVQTMGDQVISTEDCGTHNGITMDVKDSSVIDRYLAKPIDEFQRNELVTTKVVDTLVKRKETKITVRSPMMCEAHQGICSKCYGLNEKGHPIKIGINVGMRSAHALSEPLTQAMLSSKHAAGTAKQKTKELTGFKGVSLLVKVPETFSNAAVLARRVGNVSPIESAPQGGSYVTIGDEDHHVPPNLDVIVKNHDFVELGDRLSSGIPKPNEVMEHKGLGVGRKYFIDTLHKVFKDTITDVDKRHIEVLAKAQLSHAEVEHDPEGRLLRGDIVHFNKLRERLQEEIKSIPTDQGKGHILAKDYYEYMVGTEITAEVVRKLKELGINQVDVAVNPPQVKFVMKPITHAPLLNPDFMARLAHQYLARTITEGAAYGDTSNIHGYHPVAPFVHGVEFTRGDKGTY